MASVVELICKVSQKGTVLGGLIGSAEKKECESFGFRGGVTLGCGSGVSGRILGSSEIQIENNGATVVLDGVARVNEITAKVVNGLAGRLFECEDMLESLDDGEMGISGLIERQIDAPDCSKEPDTLFRLVTGLVVRVRFQLVPHGPSALSVCNGPNS